MTDKSRRWSMPVASLVLATSFCAASGQAQQQQAEEAGFISQVKGTCWLQRGNSRVQITLSKFGGAGLRVGDKLRCDKHGSLVLELRSLRTTIEPSEQWTTIPRASGVEKRRDGWPRR